MTGFLDLPDELLILILNKTLGLQLTLHIFRDSADGSFELFAPERGPNWAVLLFVNHKLNRIASRILYSCNEFAIEDGRAGVDLVEPFLLSIGSANAANIFRLRTTFPQVKAVMGNAADLELTCDGEQKLRAIATMCTGLTTLKLDLRTSMFGMLRLDGTVNGTAGPDSWTLLSVSNWLENLSALEKIEIVPDHAQRLVRDAPKAISEMRRLGWTVVLD